MKNNKKCPTCGKTEHNFLIEEAFECVPPRGVLNFGSYVIDKEYREALFEEFPMYNTEEVVGSYLGHNPYFPSQAVWFEDNEK